MKDIRIIVATHKEYPMPSDPMYLPLHVGAVLHRKLMYAEDSTGENISYKNFNYCELTGIYWAWKNLDADYIGLCHYRRYFSRFPMLKPFKKAIFSNILTKDEASLLLSKAPVLLPQKRNYFIESVYQQYSHAHHHEDLDILREVLQEYYPEYLSAFDAEMKGSSLHIFNMFIMQKEIFDRYCSWLFEVLFLLEKRIDLTNYSDYDKRVFGFLAERLMDTWIYTNHISYIECPCINLEPPNWPKKITLFLKRKFFQKRY